MYMCLQYTLVGRSLCGHCTCVLGIDIFAEIDVPHTGPGAPLVHRVAVIEQMQQ